ncbi:sigma factor-like helix-turn-helix DNA-binding protein [Tissierella sp.]|uniref:sigma factor-like helix-turn-helix DNA-binding protein n=1 Tax=Tissierella sp. TaxID=41274 RepID=UPI0028B1390F|nr:sigma factor-like helix-turn-helix DNA-binding protein [Tissierella sp.]
MSNMYNGVEKMLYSYYKTKKRIDGLKSRLIRIENRIERLTKDIKECNIDLEDTIKAIDYSRDIVQGNIVSNIEIELERAVDNILKEIEDNIRDKYKTKSKITNLQKKIDNIDTMLEELTEEEAQILKLRYSEKLSDNRISYIINMSRSTVQRKRIELINNLSEIMSK